LLSLPATHTWLALSLRLLTLRLLRCFLVQAFAPFVQRGFLEFVYGGADVGAYCCQHELVAAVHLTGSEATYNNIMFGSPQVRATGVRWPQSFCTL
jgi:acyl-CoA reductase-like NAD-dependent aldehyde dehydrogenase